MTLGLTLQGRTNGSLQMTDVVGDEVRQVCVFGVAPESLSGIEFGRVGWEPFKLDMLQSRCSDLLRGRAVHRPAIQADNQRPPKLLSQLANEVNQFVRANVVFMNLNGRADTTAQWRECDAANNAQAVISIPSSLHRRLARRCPSAAIHRLQAEASFIDKYNGCTATPRFFLIRGQSSRRHRTTASESCSLATCRGFCGLNPRSWRIRDRWPGLYRTRNRLRTTSTTRAQVHKSVRYPAAIGPANRISTNSCFCFRDSLDTPPGCGFAAKASTPPVFHARFQRFTLERLTPKRSAISRRGFRSWKNSAARRRRASSSAALPGVLIQHNTVLAPGMVHSRRKDQ